MSDLEHTDWLLIHALLLEKVNTLREFALKQGPSAVVNGVCTVTEAIEWYEELREKVQLTLNKNVERNHRG